MRGEGHQNTLVSGSRRAKKQIRFDAYQHLPSRERRPSSSLSLLRTYYTC